MEQLKISKIRVDGGTQPRAEIDNQTVNEYRQDMLIGDSFPPLVVFYDGSDYWLADGFHRLWAAIGLKKEEINVDIRQGTQRDAILHSVQANSTHGKRRTNEDKRRAVMRLLEDNEWSQWSDREIARRCAVDNKTVGNLRKTVTVEIPQLEIERTYTTKHGTISTMKTANIGKVEEIRQAAIKKPELFGGLLAKVNNGNEKTAYKEFKKLDKVERKTGVPDHLPPKDDRYELFHCPISELKNHVKPNSIDFIVTDPPYPKEFIDLYGELAEFSAYALKEGGSLLAMAGQSYIPDILEQLNKYLTYQWTLSYITPGGQSPQIWDRKVNAFWKPVFWFVKGTYSGDWIGDVIKSDVNDNDKRFHMWGQSESGIANLIDKFTYPGDVICDPFLGGGTTGLVSVKMNRIFIGADSDNKALETTIGRLNDSV